MIHIFLRQTSHNKLNSLRPEWFSYEKCFKNLLDTTKQNCELTVVFDGNMLEHFTEKYQGNNRFNIKFITAGNDFSSNIQTFEIIKQDINKVNDNDLIYVLENDYLHTDNWVNAVNELNFGDNYISLFDHPDKYYFQQNTNDEYGMYKNLVSKIYLSNSRYWRTVPSTCASFLMNKKVFLEDYDIHGGKADNTRFDILTRTKNRLVFSPMPGLATHCQNPWFSPFINWKEISDLTI